MFIDELECSDIAFMRLSSLIGEKGETLMIIMCDIFREINSIVLSCGDSIEDSLSAWQWPYVLFIHYGIENFKLSSCRTFIIENRNFSNESKIRRKQPDVPNLQKRLTPKAEEENQGNQNKKTYIFP